MCPGLVGICCHLLWPFLVSAHCVLNLHAFIVFAMWHVNIWSGLAVSISLRFILPMHLFVTYSIFL